MYVQGLDSFCCKVEDLVSIELAYINTNHPDFIGGKHAAYESVLAVKVRCTPVKTCTYVVYLCTYVHAYMYMHFMYLCCVHVPYMLLCFLPKGDNK